MRQHERAQAGETALHALDELRRKRVEIEDGADERGDVGEGGAPAQAPAQLRADGGAPEADIRLRLDALHAFERRDAVDPRVNRDALRRARAAVDQLRRQLGVRDAPADVEEAGILLALAYPDRIGQRRESSGRSDDPGGGRFLLRNGRGAALGTRQALSAAEFLVAVELDDRRPESRIFLAAPVTLDDLESQFAAQIIQDLSG